MLEKLYFFIVSQKKKKVSQQSSLVLVMIGIRPKLIVWLIRNPTLFMGDEFFEKSKKIEVYVFEVQLDLISSTEGSRFIEAYNPSTAVTLTDLDLDGIFEGKVTSDSALTLPQASYLVLYDKGAPTMVSCQDCKCSKNSNNLCTDAVYIGCCSSGCSCYFGGSSMSNTNWHVSLMDIASSQTTDTVDSVTYDSSTWPQIMKGYTYSLKYIGYDNHQGSNWQQSCNTQGTQGIVPNYQLFMELPCTDQQCQLNGASNANCQGSGSSQKCDCNSNNYYFADRTCNSVPPPGDCYAYWIKNETTNSRYVTFEWGAAATDRDHKYQLIYYTRTGSSDQVTTSSRTKTVSDYDYSRGVNSLAGTVQTQILGSDGLAAYSSSQYCYRKFLCLLLFLNNISK
ncbi:hypothetical protein RFI_07021 [Reticulomyxa filosa]|uniref:LTD domain-containing protein n=1 Tax=Reticulomyxa filosa TaxID=46433 RepID=X6NW37_RETFI|nr:hypothetical protein RFI_07021 [Reticulomyxa filosa]|eukprot:ETO30098.1 hypothetical protein RFI_07021 [Reticulomyxa filosa]